MGKSFKIILLLLCLFLAKWIAAQQGQINIPRITSMPDQPSPYNMRDWKMVAMKYDSFIYDKNKSGQYLPLVSYTANGISYLNQKQIRLHTYVGTKSPQNSEGINVLPSLVGAVLSGQDIRNMYGLDRLVMAQDFFNKANGENLYLNNSSAGSGGDWWYDVMPNVYFYQLYDLFPDFNAEATYQFTTVADKFLTATQKMGGSATPWSQANMNYRAWNFKTMEGNANGVKEPEAAGTFGWLLYHAFKKTNHPDYLKGAEWSLEFLNSLNTNPSYELQLPYGVLAAAKMNAEIGTDYNIEKMVNWCFNRGPLRGWGTIVGKWGSMDVSGLVGEANDGGNDYAFLMNGMQQAAALVPLVRYDKKFAKAIGKWMVNLSNASRLFYPGFLPSAQQDGAVWSLSNDTDAVIAHEAMKQKLQNLSPFATGDALGGGWASTNLAIYGSSSVGYLGAIVKKTNVDKILELNLNATDFYAEASYPSYLYYNSYDTPKAVLLDVGNGQHDIYEAISEKIISQNKTGQVSIIIPAKEAVMVVVTPTGGEIRYDKNKMLVNGVVVDFDQTQMSYTVAPRIKALEAQNYLVEKGKTTKVFCTAVDVDSDSLKYFWNSDAGTINGEKEDIIWTAPSTIGKADIKVVVKDNEGNSDSLTVTIEVVDIINISPKIISLTANNRYIGTNQTVSVFCDAEDENEDLISYFWSSDHGSINGSGSNITWKAPDTEGIYFIHVTVDDGKGLTNHGQILILVKNFDDEGQLIAWYPFNGNANDKSGNEHHGTTKGAILTADFDGRPLSSYYFNGGAQHIEVKNTPLLNFQDGISISLWCKPNLTADKETFLFSHGSWQNRWKLSIIPTGNLRWTINTLTSIVDLDTDFVLKTDSIYHIVASYDGGTMMLFVNGKLNIFKKQTGKIRSTTLPLLIGQMLPSDANYNFKGIMDEIKIYDYALNPGEIERLFEQGIISNVQNITLAGSMSIYPNPADQSLFIDHTRIKEEMGSMTITNLMGVQMMEIDIKNKTNTNIDISSLTPGTYILQIKNLRKETIQSTQFIKS